MQIIVAAAARPADPAWDGGAAATCWVAELLVTHQAEDRQGELTIASSNTSRGTVYFTHRYMNKQHDSFKASQNLNPGSAPELNRTGQSDLERKKKSFLIGKGAIGLKDDSGAILSSKYTYLYYKG